MSRVTSLTNMPEEQLNRWIKRIGLLFLVLLIAFVAFYAVDRFRPATPSIADRQLASAEQAVRDKPGDIAARGALADIYVSRQRYDEAISQYTQILATGKGVELAHFGRGAAYVALKRYDEAIADYKAVVDIASKGEMAAFDTTLESAYYALGQIAMAQNNPAEAITQLNLALQIKRSDGDALYLIGTAYTATGKFDDAEHALRSAISFVPVGWADPYTAMADLYTKAGKPAMAEWATAMAAGATGTGDTQAAIDRLTKIAEDPAAGFDAKIGLGLMYELRKDAAQATAWYQKALAQKPDSSEARLGLGRVSSGPGGGSALPSLPAPAPASQGTN